MKEIFPPLLCCEVPLKGKMQGMGMGTGMGIAMRMGMGMRMVACTALPREK